MFVELDNDTILDWDANKLATKGFTLAQANYILNTYSFVTEKQLNSWLVGQNDFHFGEPISEFQFVDKYAKFDPQLKRRETWDETINRTLSFLQELGNKYSPEATESVDWPNIHQSIRTLDVMPSMRLLSTAGEAARRYNASLYNCCYLELDSIQALKEMLFILMCGTGVGYSVETHVVARFPPVPNKLIQNNFAWQIADSTEGWVLAWEHLLESLFSGHIPNFDFSLIRKAGSPLKVKGGTASGPEPLQELFSFTINLFLENKGNFLSTLNIHDIACKLGSVVISGGVRRSALIALFSENDTDMLNCKNMDYELLSTQYSHRFFANNSVVITERKTKEYFQNLFDIIDSGYGEPGIFSRFAASNTRPNRRKDVQFGTNPCAEILLRNKQFCNLSSVVARADDTLDSLKRKVEIATIIGTFQSLATDFTILSNDWKENCDEERLLGVDIMGHLDYNQFTNKQLEELLDVAKDTNEKLAKQLGVNKSTAITTVKPSGNSSILVDASPGIHPRWSNYYIRRVRLQNSSHVAKTLIASGFKALPDNGENPDNPYKLVFEFPVKSPNGAITRNELSAIDQLNYWLQVKVFWTEHNPSCSIYYEKDEIPDIIDFLYDNQHWAGGLSFFPKTDSNYPLAPYEEITEKQYNESVQNTPAVDWGILYIIESHLTNIDQSSDLECSADGCVYI